MVSKERLIKAMGEEAYEIGLILIDENRLCPYDDDFTVKEKMLETGRCMHCFVVECPINQ